MIFLQNCSDLQSLFDPPGSSAPHAHVRPAPDARIARVGVVVGLAVPSRAPRAEVV